ncbi:MAG: DMT family transporter [Azospirillaceae bacterium]
MTDRPPGTKGGGRGPLVAAWLGWWYALPANLRGALWVLLGSAGFSMMSVLAKTLGQNWSSFQIAFFRCAIALVVLLPLIARAGPGIFVTRVLRFHLWRAAAGIAAMMCGFYAVTHLPLATATAITFAKPLFMVLVAVLLLGETVRWRRWLATGVGFLGVVVMVRPGVAAFDPAMLVALTQALMIALSVAVVKKLPPAEPNLTVLAYFGVISTIVTGAIVPFVWVAPTLEELGLAVTMGAVGLAAQASVIRGFRVAEASAVAPFDYSRLLFATFFGFVIFTEIPDVWTIAGAAIIVGSTVYIARREARIVRPRRRADPDPH